MSAPPFPPPPSHAVNQGHMWGYPWRGESLTRLDDPNGSADDSGVDDLGDEADDYDDGDVDDEDDDDDDHGDGGGDGDDVLSLQTLANCSGG